jgi:hypothetical protein
LLTCVGRVFVATGGVVSGFAALGSIVGDFNPWVLNYDSVFLIGLSPHDARIVIVSVVALFTVEIFQERGVALRETLAKQNAAFQWVATLAGIFVVLLWGRYGYGYDPIDFVYRGY